MKWTVPTWRKWILVKMKCLAKRTKMRMKKISPLFMTLWTTIMAWSHYLNKKKKTMNKKLNKMRMLTTKKKKTKKKRIWNLSNQLRVLIAIIVISERKQLLNRKAKKIFLMMQK
ncbi:hypothetical protein BDF21DRAFT_415304 [Thamnidium elegans]|nr:hypothetical protein BDF21DRAFT_415304 [Thamnidium elegans]